MSQLFACIVYQMRINYEWCLQTQKSIFSGFIWTYALVQWDTGKKCGLRNLWCVNSAVVLTTKLFGEPFQATASVSNVLQGHIK